MTDTTQTEAPELWITFAGTRYLVITELTEREKFEAERVTGVGLDEMKAYTTALVLAFFTLRRAAVESGKGDERITWEWFLDSSEFEFETPAEQNGSDPTQADETEIVGETTETTGTPDTQPSSASSPGT